MSSGDINYDRINDYGAVRISLASPHDIRSWSFGEVKKPETINYRTYRPEKDGLFCERIFGPEKDWECACGKYRGMKYKGMICDRCGVKVTHSRVRRKRMGHIELAAPVVHIWFFKAMPSRLGTLLDMKTTSLEKVIYFQDYVVTDPGDTPLKKHQLLNEDDFRKARESYGDSFEAEMGAEAVRKLLEVLNLVDLSQGPAPEARNREPQGQAVQAEAARPREAAQGGGIAPRFRPGRPAEQGRVDGAGVHPGHPAGPAAARAARQRQLRHQRLERPLSAHHQPQQPAQEAGGPQRPRGHHPQREADAAAVGGRAVRQQPLQAAGAGQQQPPAQVADRHDQGQAGPLPREPARQARRLLGPLRHRRRPRTAAAPVRPAQEDRPGAVPAVHHPPAQGTGPRRHHQVGQEDARTQGRHRLGHPGRGHPQPPGAAQPGADAAPHGHPGLRAGADRRQRHPHPPARLQGLQRRLRRRPDGRASAAVDRGAGRGDGADDVHQQHLQPGQRPADHQPVAGHRHGLLLPDGDPRRAGRVHRGRRGQEVQQPGRGAYGLRPEEARRPRPHLGAAADREEGHRRGARRQGQDEDRGDAAQAQRPGADHRRPGAVQRHSSRENGVLRPGPGEQDAGPHHRRLLPAARAAGRRSSCWTA